MKAQEEDWRRAMLAGLAGDESAYRALLSGLVPFLRALARRGCASAGLGAAEAEDVVQETLLAIHLKRHTWDVSQSFTPWISAIARNKLIDALRRRGRRAEVDVSDFENVLASPENDEFERRDALRLLSQLSEKQRAAIEAVSIKGESLRQTARNLAMSEVAVRVAIHRGLKTLAALYRKSES